MVVTAIADIGERHGFRGAANKSAVIAPLNEHMKKAFRKWQFLHRKREQNWSKNYCEINKYVAKVFLGEKISSIGHSSP